MSTCLCTVTFRPWTEASSVRNIRSFEGSSPSPSIISTVMRWSSDVSASISMVYNSVFSCWKYLWKEIKRTLWTSTH